MNVCRTTRNLAISALLLTGTPLLAMAQADRDDDRQSQTDDQNKQQQTQYQDQQSSYAEQKENYDEDMRNYEALRNHYRAERAVYHRHAWEPRYSSWILRDNAEGLLGSHLQVADRHPVGVVTAVARIPGGQIEALRVTLTDDSIVWLDADDVRFDHDRLIVLTDLDERDIHDMARERL